MLNCGLSLCFVDVHEPRTHDVSKLVIHRTKLGNLFLKNSMATPNPTRFMPRIVHRGGSGVSTWADEHRWKARLETVDTGTNNTTQVEEKIGRA